MPQIQAATSPRPSHRPAERHTATNVSCTASSTSAASLQRRVRRRTSHGACRVYSVSRASRSPVATPRTSAASLGGSSAGSGTDLTVASYVKVCTAFRTAR